MIHDHRRKLTAQDISSPHSSPSWHCVRPQYRHYTTIKFYVAPHFTQTAWTSPSIQHDSWSSQLTTQDISSPHSSPSEIVSELQSGMAFPGACYHWDVTAWSALHYNMDYLHRVTCLLDAPPLQKSPYFVEAEEETTGKEDALNTKSTAERPVKTQVTAGYCCCLNLKKTINIIVMFSIVYLL